MARRYFEDWSLMRIVAAAAERSRWRDDHFEDWHMGKRLEHEMRRTVTETDNLLIATLTHKPRRLHLDTDAAVEHP